MELNVTRNTGTSWHAQWQVRRRSLSLCALPVAGVAPLGTERGGGLARAPRCVGHTWPSRAQPHAHTVVVRVIVETKSCYSPDNPPCFLGWHERLSKSGPE